MKKAPIILASFFSDLRQFCLVWMTILLLSACVQHRPSTRVDALSRKAEPYDHFSQQRSWPDAAFDWSGWRQQMQSIKTVESLAAKGDPCAGNATQWTLQGPSNIAGRCNTLAVKPDDENTVLAGFASGGIWKTTDGGTNWRPVFDDNLELSIGDITYDPQNTNIVYAGTGDPNMPSQVFNGNGVYKSNDGGETWDYLGLGEQGIISKIVIDPVNTQNLYAASMGNPYVRTPERGIYKSTDGGMNWQHVLFVSEQAGASDLVMAPGNPKVLYASFWDRIRSNTESIVYGPNAKIYKSTDGGKNWVLLGGGLPTGKMGRTGLAISATNSEKVWAVYVDTLSRTGGLYKTTDGGLNWTAQNITVLSEASADFGWYFGKIRLNPKNDEDIYFLAVLLWRRSLNSTNQWNVAAGGHADSHDLVFTPSGRRYWANDGGVYRNQPNETFFEKCKNLPTMQIYRTDFNPTEPNMYFVGAQDNGVNKGNLSSGLNNWQDIFSADGFACAFDPNDNKRFWVETQNGAIHRTTDGGLNFNSAGTCLGTNDRCNWDTPFMMSRHKSNTLYAATYRVYFSTDGSGWGLISDDLTDGNIYGARFHSISTLDESPVQEGKLFAGTTDGNVWWRNPSGAWRNISSGLPDRYVTSVHGSPTAVDRIYVTHSGFRHNDETPHIHRSNNNGISWTNIRGDLPNMPVNDLFVLPGHADSIICIATDIGVYYTRNGGVNWNRLGKGMPYVVTTELVHNTTRRELVAATYGRSLWTFPLDSILAQKPTVSIVLSGKIQTESGKAMEEVQLNSTPAVFSNANGLYSIGNQAGCSSFDLIPELNRNPLNGVSTYDLVLISKHILGLENINSPLKMIAADANRSNSITTLDIVTLRRLILGIDTAIAGNKSWRFIPKSHVFPNPQNPFEANFPEFITAQKQTSNISNLDFWGIKVGDLNDDASPGFAAPLEDRNLEEWPIQTRMINLPDGKVQYTFSAPVSPVCAAQLSLHFNVQLFDFEDIEPLLSNLTLEHFNLKNAKQGVISFSFEHLGAGPFPVGEALLTQDIFSLVLKAKQTTVHPESAFQLSHYPTPSFAFRNDGSKLNPTLEIGTPVQQINYFSNVSPNPFGSGGFTLQVALPYPVPAIIEIYDNTGQLMVSRAVNQGDLHFERRLFPKTGQYYYQILQEKDKKVIEKGKMIYLE